MIRWEDGVLHARVAAAPVQGAANKALLALLSDALEIPKSRLSLHSGETSRDKVVRFIGWDAATLEARIAAALKGSG